MTLAPTPSAPTGERARRAHRPGPGRRGISRQTLAFWGFIAPMAIGLLVFVVVPIVWGLILSVSNAQTTITPDRFVGLDNYVAVLGDPAFRGSLVLVVVFALVIVPTTLGFSLLLALLVNAAPWGKGIFRTIFFIPTACSYVVASVVWKMSLFNGLPTGLANSVLGFFGLEPIAWIGTTTPPWFWIVLVTVRLWLQAGFFMIIFTAGLQEIPRELYEAAQLDGIRGPLQELRYITLPLLRNTTVSVMLLCLIGAFQAFDEFYNILGSAGGGGQGNMSAAMTPLVYLYKAAFADQNYGLGSAGAFVLTALILIITLIQGRVFGLNREK
ncbi:sugar ABC transporter permease [Mycetocola tolaasinivorans]|uniref:Sugar ABC transporter permease n=1 Tax=Mycetocola tolaasinivorans TaxID=76635 RepID=A0A3L7A7H1_9MICO|nr:sugar ABC transporter permease [Mycetocola tolaasinivorans]RLP76025.1 sugar ABC transporter permease [Mycetocola tolaasinivorans]